MLIASFNICSSDKERQLQLRNSLTPEIQNHLDQTLFLFGSSAILVDGTSSKLSQPCIVATACLSSLLQLKPFKNNDLKSLKKSLLQAVVATLQMVGYDVKINSSTTLAQLVAKLPPILRSPWVNVSFSIPGSLPNFIDFNGWLEFVAMADSSIQVGIPTETTVPNCTNIGSGMNRIPSYTPESTMRKPRFRVRLAFWNTYWLAARHSSPSIRISRLTKFANSSAVSDV